MQIRLFTISVSDSGGGQEEMNSFLRSHKVLSVSENFVQNENGACWCFAVRYLVGKINYEKKLVSEKIDYKTVLTETEFSRFSLLRQRRKKIADENGIPAYAVFTDAELSEIAKIENPEISTLQKIEGIGKKKIEKYAQLILAK